MDIVAHRPEFVEVSTGGKGFGRHLVLIGSRPGENVAAEALSRFHQEIQPAVVLGEIIKEVV